MDGLPRMFLWASLPAALLGVWNLGEQLRAAAPAIWQIEGLRWLGLSPGESGLLPAVAMGAALFLPLLLTALAVSRAWAEVFARLRGRPLDSGWALAAWWFALLAPATLPLPMAALCLSFGVVFGSHVFGGRYIVNPALLGIVFAAIAYPPLVADTQWLPGATVPSSFALAVVGGEPAADLAWSPLFLGSEIGAIGTPSDLACLLGAVFLIARGAASARIVIGAVAGLAAAGTLFGELPWYWHLALGHFTFLVAFVATDPTTEPTTKPGCWAFGALLGVLTVVLRVANPDHPEGSWFALLLASLFIPLFDHGARAGARWLRPAAPVSDG